MNIFTPHCCLWSADWGNMQKRYTSISAATCFCACTRLHFDERHWLIRADEWHWKQQLLPAWGPSSVLSTAFFPVYLQKKQHQFTLDLITLHALFLHHVSTFLFLYPHLFLLLVNLIQNTANTKFSPVILHLLLFRHVPKAVVVVPIHLCS